MGNLTAWCLDSISSKLQDSKCTLFMCEQMLNAIVHVP